MSAFFAGAIHLIEVRHVITERQVGVLHEVSTRGDGGKKSVRQRSWLSSTSFGKHEMAVRVGRGGSELCSRAHRGDHTNQTVQYAAPASERLSPRLESNSDRSTTT